MSRKQRKIAAQKKTNRRKRQKNILALSLIFILTLSGFWLILWPTIEKLSVLSEQEELLATLATAAPIPDVVYTVEPTPAPITESSPTPSSVETPIPTTNDVAISYVPDDEVQKISLENSGLAAIGTMEIENIALKLPVVCGVSEKQLKIALGLVPETVAIGQIGNAVIAGHRSYTYGKFLNRLGEVAIGDSITYTPKDGEAITFEVFEIAVIEPADQIAFVQPSDETIITLYTCTPIKEATHRMLVRARKIEGGTF